MPGFVSLVGAGPWDPDLLTLAARERLRRADVVIVDYLVNPALLMHCRPDATLLQRAAGPHDTKRLTQQEVNRLMVEHALQDQHVVRLKGGDPMMFGRGAEEATVLRAADIPFEFVPGVSSPIAAPQYAGIPITHRDHTPSVSFVSGFEAYDKKGLQVAWDHLAQSAGTLVLMMSVKNCRQNAERLIRAGRDASTPAAVIRWGTRGIQECIEGDLSDIADKIEAAGLRPPAVLVVGDVVRKRESLRWFDRGPLSGRRIVLTRSAEQNDRFGRRLRKLGADVVPIATLRSTDPDDIADWHNKLKNAHHRFGIILSSPRGVDALYQALEATRTDIRKLAHLQWVAVGRATAAQLSARGIHADLIPNQASSEGLVEGLRSQNWLDKDWLHIRGAQGRPLLGNAVLAAGGQYQLAIAYQCERPRVPEMLLRSLDARDAGGESFDAICFSSRQTTENFLETATSVAPRTEVLKWLEKARVVAMGPVTAAALQKLGIRVDQTAEATHEDAQLQALLDAFDTKTVADT